jgi:hypothetical protein
MRPRTGSRGAVGALALVLAVGVAACPGSPTIAPDEHGRPGKDFVRAPEKSASSMEDIVAESMNCTVVVDSAGLPNRAEAMLEKDRGAVSGAAHFLAGTSDRGEERTTPRFTTDDLRAAIVSEEALRRRAAAVLIGRCRVEDAGVTSSLSDLVDQRLEVEADPMVQVELAMSRALLGDTRGVSVSSLEVLVKGDPKGRASCAAASYLAQQGKTTGWSALVAAFDASQPTPVRVDAVMASSAFGPLHAQATPDGGRVDVRGFLAVALTDKELGVRQAAIPALVEVQHPDATALLTSVEANDPSAGVRAVASHWLWHLRRAAPTNP